MHISYKFGRCSCCVRAAAPWTLFICLLLFYCMRDMSAACVCLRRCRPTVSLCLILVFRFPTQLPSLSLFFLFISHFLHSTSVTCMRCYLLYHVNKLISNATIAVLTISEETNDRLAVALQYIPTYTNNKHFSRAPENHKIFSSACAHEQHFKHFTSLHFLLIFFLSSNW